MGKASGLSKRWVDPVGESAIRRGATNEAADEAKPCSVYYLHNAEHELLYVGISVKVMARFGAHDYDKDWWPEVAYASIEHMPTVAHARHREAAAIQKLNPKYNIVRPKYSPCENCGDTKNGPYRDVCDACYQYQRKYDEPRPARLYNKVRNA